jgi:lipid-A-disaccharide synthase
VSRIFLVAGESSGDTHGSHLIRALRRLDPALQYEGLGGRLMAEAGMALREDLASRAIMGFTEVVKSLAYIRRVFKDTVAYLADSRPAVLVLIDYPGFNIRLAAEAHALGIPVVWYISPQVWAWKKGRVATLARVVTKMLVILPFEKEIYDRAGLDCVFVGHPLFDHIAATPVTEDFAGPMTIGLMPGSREQEIRRIFPVMLETADKIIEAHPEARFVTPVVDAERAAQVRALARSFPLEVVEGRFYDVLHGARFCLVASGTATVETAAFGVPMAVLYKVTPVTYWLARFLVEIDAIAMVNILAGHHIVPEFIQQEARVERIVPEILPLLDDTPARAHMIDALRNVREMLGGPGASDRAAAEILRTLGIPAHG